MRMSVTILSQASQEPVGMFSWTFALPMLGSVTAAWQAWHSTPQNCRDRVLNAVAFCLGTDSDRRLVSAVELICGLFALALAFLCGRFTADWDLGFCWAGERREIVFVGAPRSRFSSDDAGRSARASERRESSTRTSN